MNDSLSPGFTVQSPQAATEGEEPVDSLFWLSWNSIKNCVHSGKAIVKNTADWLLQARYSSHICWPYVEEAGFEVEGENADEMGHDPRAWR